MEDKEIAELIQQCNEGKISLQELQEKLAGSKLKIYDTRVDRNPRYPEGNNGSRNSFTFNPFNHPKGRFFQGIVKKAILRAIDFAHGAMVKDYDKDAYRYDDERLRALEEFGRSYIAENFRDFPEKPVFMTKLLDIVLGIAKEDIYYRARMFDMLNSFAAKRQAFALTAEEQENLARVRMREYFCASCQAVHEGVPPLTRRAGEGYQYTCLESQWATKKRGVR